MNHTYLTYAAGLKQAWSIYKVLVTTIISPQQSNLWLQQQPANDAGCFTVAAIGGECVCMFRMQWNLPHLSRDKFYQAFLSFIFSLLFSGRERLAWGRGYYSCSTWLASFPGLPLCLQKKIRAWYNLSRDWRHRLWSISIAWALLICTHAFWICKHAYQLSLQH